MESIFEDELPPFPECFLNSNSLNEIVTEIKNNTDIQVTLKSTYNR